MNPIRPFYFLALFLLANTFAAAQVATPTLGISPFGTYSSGNSDTVDLTTGNVFVHVPLFSLPQLGKLSLSVSANLNTQGYAWSEFCFEDVCNPLYYRSIPFGPVVTFDQFLGLQLQQPADALPGLSPLISVANASGAVAPLALVVPSTFTGVYLYQAEAAGVYQSAGGTYTLSGSLYTEDGISYAMPSAHNEIGPGGECCVYVPGPTVIADPSGNKITTTISTPPFGSTNLDYYGYYQNNFLFPNGSITDSVGHIIDFHELSPTHATNCPSLSIPNFLFPQNQIYNKYQLWVSASEQYTFCTIQLTWNTPARSYGTLEAIQSIILPNGTYWGFLYDTDGPNPIMKPCPTYLDMSQTCMDPDNNPKASGNLARLILPTGGMIDYTYTPDIKDYPPDINDAVHTRTVSDANDGAGIWTYDFPGLNPVTGPYCETYFPATTMCFQYTTQTATVTDPAGNYTKHTFSSTDPYGIYPGPIVETGVQRYSSAHQLLQAITKDYSETASYRIGPFPNKITTVLDDGVTSSETSYAYAPANTLFVESDPTRTSPYQVLQTAPPYHSPIETKITDFSSSGTGPVISDTVTTFKWQSPNSPYLSKTANMLNLVDTQEIRIPGTTNDAAKTTFGYDENTIAGAVCTFCGNLTSTKRVLAGSNQTVVTSTKYNSQGMPVTLTDANINLPTIITYDSTGIFPSQIQGPAVNGVNQIQKYTFDPMLGKPTSITDLNNNTTYYTYDVMGRVTDIRYPAIAAGTPETSACYSDMGGSLCPATNPPYSIYTKTLATPDPARTTASQYDGLGRPYISSSGGSSVRTYYNDATDQVGFTTVPYVGDIYSTPSTIGTKYLYDALGRKQSQLNTADGTTQKWVPNANTLDYYDE